MLVAETLLEKSGARLRAQGLRETHPHDKELCLVPDALRQAMYAQYLFC